MKKIPAFVLSAALLVPFSTSVYAADPVPVVQNQPLTYEQAVEKAFQASYTLKNAAEEIDRTFEIRQNTGEYAVSAPVGTGNGTADASARSIFKGISQADASWGISKQKYEVTKDGIAYSVKVAYNNLLKAQKQKILADQTAKTQETQKSIATYKAMNGTLSQYELSQEDGKYEAALKQKEVAAQVLTDAYERFNSLIGAPKEARFVLNDEPKFTSFDRNEKDVENDITYVLANSNAVAMAEEQVKLKNLDLELFSYNTGAADSYKAKEIDVRKAGNDVQDTKKKLADGMRTTYNTIKQLEDQYKALNIELAKAEESLKMAKIRYDLGVGIRADAEAAELAVASKQKAIFDIVVQLDNLHLGYQKPWVMS